MDVEALRTAPRGDQSGVYDSGPVPEENIGVSARPNIATFIAYDTLKAFLSVYGSRIFEQYWPRQGEGRIKHKMQKQHPQGKRPVLPPGNLQTCPADRRALYFY